MPESTIQTPLKPLKRLMKLLAAERKDIGLLYLYAILAGLISLSLPLGIQAIINYVSFGQMTTSWVVLVVIVIIGIILSGALNVLQLTLSEGIQQRIFVNSAFEFAYRIPKLQTIPLRERYIPELINRFFDTVNVQKGVAKLLLDLPAAFLQIVFGLILLSLYHPLFMAFGIVLVLLLGLLIRLTGPAGLSTSLDESQYKYKIAHWLQDLGRSLSMFKMFGSTNLHLQRTDKLVGGYLEARKRHFSVLLIKYWMVVLFQVLIIGTLLVIGGLLVQANEINIGQLVASEIVIILLMSSVEKLVMSMETVYDLLTGLEKIGYVADLELDNPEGHDVPNKDNDPGYSVEMHNLGFKDLQTGHVLIENFNTHIESGEIVRMDGCNTASVQAIVDSLIGQRDEYDGSIMINGLGMDGLCVETYRANIATALSARGLFEGTVLENIIMDTQPMSGETGGRVTKVLEAVGLTRFVESQGLDSRILPRGMNTAGTVRKKVVLARALMRKSRMMILQTPYRGMTSEECERFLGFLRNKHKGTTVIIVSDDRRFDHLVDAIVDPQCKVSV